MQVIDDVKEFLAELQKLLNAHLKYYQVVALEQLVTVFAKLVALVIVLLTVLTTWLFVSVWLSFAIGASIGNTGLGFLIMAGVNVLSGIILYFFRVPIFINPVIHTFSSAFEEKKGVDHGH